MNWNYTIAKKWIADVVQVLTTAITTTGALTAASLTTTSNGAITAHGSGAISSTTGTITTGGAATCASFTTTSNGAITAHGSGAITSTTGVITTGGAATCASFTTTSNGAVTAHGSGNLTTTSGDVNTDSGNLTVGGTSTLTGAVGITAALTPTGGIVGTTPLKIYNVAPQGAIASRGTDGVSVAGTTYYAQLFLPANKTITGIGVLIGTTRGTDKVLVALYDAAGNKLANSAVAGATTGTADKYQELAFDPSPVAVVGPATLLIAFQLNGTTDGMQRIATDGVEVAVGTETGSFGTILDPITSVSTSFTTAEGPIGYVY